MMAPKGAFVQLPARAPISIARSALKPDMLTPMPLSQVPPLFLALSPASAIVLIRLRGPASLNRRPMLLTHATPYQSPRQANNVLAHTPVMGLAGRKTAC